MKINNNFNTSFKGVNMIRVPYSAFSRADSLSVRADKFSDAVSRELNECPNNFVLAFADLFGLGKEATKSVVYLETPSFVATRDTFDKKRDVIERLSAVPMEPPSPRKRGEHTFYVLTGEHKDKVSEFLNFKNIKAMLAKKRDKVSNLQGLSPEESSVKLSLEAGEWLDKKVQKIIANEPVKVFKIKDLSELPEIVKKFN